ncbi:MAG: hypothetical protein KDK25_07490 [Leptospiraceae bacterium]|nr:hypothetical protein [Leptospiraceae bacterium]
MADSRRKSTGPIVRRGFVTSASGDGGQRFLGMALALLIGFCMGSCLKGPRTIVIGSKPFTESIIMSTMASLLLQQEGYTISERFGVGSMIARQALLANQIDLYPEYTGTAYTLYLDHSSAKVLSGDKLYNLVRKQDAANDIIWLDRSQVNNTYALALRKEDAARIGNTLSDLVRYNRNHPGELTFGVDHEFYERPDGFKAMARVYGLELEPDQVRTMEIGLSFESISRKQIDVAMIYSTDGKLKKYNLSVLEDDRNFFPVYNACYNVHRSVLEKHPDIPGILAPVATILDNQSMQELNYQVDGKARPAFLVAREFLEKKGLLSR